MKIQLTLKINPFNQVIMLNKYLPYIYTARGREGRKSHFQIQKSDYFLFLLINTGQKCISFLGYICSALSNTFKFWEDLLFWAKHCTKLVCLLAMEATSLFSDSDASGNWTSCRHPLLGLGQQGCPFLQNLLSQLTSPGLMKSLKRITTISSQCTRITQYF